jgi:hypothetical protein
MNKVTSDFKVLDALKADIMKKSYVKVGLLAGKRQNRDNETQTNADIGFKHEFGSFSEGIPPRSFLRMPIEEKRNTIIEYMSSKSVEDTLVKKGVENALALVGVMVENVIQDAFETKGFGKWQPNSQFTVDKKGSSSPLIDTGQLRRAIWSEVVK